MIISELEAGSMATGIGFSWTKFSAFASDWSEFVSNGDPNSTGITEESARQVGTSGTVGAPQA